MLNLSLKAAVNSEIGHVVTMMAVTQRDRLYIGFQDIILLYRLECIV